MTFLWWYSICWLTIGTLRSLYEGVGGKMDRGDSTPLMRVVALLVWLPYVYYVWLILLRAKP